MKVNVALIILAAGLGLLLGFKWGKMSAPVIKVQGESMGNEVKTAVSLLGVMELKYEQGEIGIVQAKQIGKELVEGLKFGENNQYQFWVMENGQASSSGGFSMEYKPWGWRVGVRQ